MDVSFLTDSISHLKNDVVCKSSIKDNTNSRHCVMYLINEIKDIIYGFLNAKDQNRSIVATQQSHMLS